MKNSKHDSNLPSFILKGFAMKISYCAATVQRAPRSLEPALHWIVSLWEPGAPRRGYPTRLLSYAERFASAFLNVLVTDAALIFSPRCLNLSSLCNDLPCAPVSLHTLPTSLFPQFSFCLALLYVPLP